MNNEGLIWGGDLFFSLRATEIWGPGERPYPLLDFFSLVMMGKNLIDVSPAKLIPTLRIKMVGEEQIEKRID
jgi:hypothetical protein